MALLSSIQMILPVPVICVLSLVLTFNLNRAIGFVLLAVVLVVLILAFFMIRAAPPSVPPASETVGPDEHRFPGKPHRRASGSCV